MAEAAVAYTTQAPAFDPFAMGGLTPSVGASLWLEHETLNDLIETEDDAKRSAAMVARQIEIEDQIETLLAKDKAWLIAQVKLLRQWCRDCDWADRNKDLVRRIIAGIATALYVNK